MHFLANTTRNHGLQSGKFLIHLTPSLPLNDAVCSLSGYLLSGNRAGACWSLCGRSGLGRRFGILA